MTDLDPAIAALSFPVVMLSLLGLAFTAAAARGPAALAAMNRRAPDLYLAVLLTHTTVAVVLTGVSAETLGVVHDELAPWALRTVALGLGGVAAAVTLLLAELELALRLSRRRVSAAGEPGRVTIARSGAEARAAAATGGRKYLVEAMLFAVGEEVLWRGIGVRAVGADYDGTTEIVLVAAGIGLFGGCHLYFGARAVAGKSAVGAIWTALTVAALGIIPAVLSHGVYQVLVRRWNQGRARLRPSELRAEVVR